MRDSALKRRLGGFESDLEFFVGNELMRDSALKLITVFGREGDDIGLEMSSCATAL